MKIRFANSDSIRKQVSKYSPTTDASEFWVPLTRGRDYVVCAVAFASNDVHYFVVDDDALPWPMPYDATAFEIVDAQISAFWSFGLSPMNPDYHALLSFREWVEDASFYDRLTNSETDCVAAFERFLTSHDEGSESARASGGFEV